MIVDKDGRVSGSIDVSHLAALHAQADDEELLAHYRQVAAENGIDLEEQQAEAPEELVAVEPPGVFDPAQHTVAEVNDYLAQVDEEEASRVLDAELAGKARSTLLGPKEE